MSVMGKANQTEQSSLNKINATSMPDIISHSEVAWESL